MEVEIRFSKAKITKAIPKRDNSRPTLHYVHLNPKTRTLEAVDGMMLISLPVVSETEALPDCLIPWEAVEEAQILSSVMLPILFLDTEAKTIRTLEGTVYHWGEGKYPDTSRVIPKRENLSHLASLDVNRLRDCALGITTHRSKCISLYQDPTSGGRTPFVIDAEFLGSTDGKTAFAILMPTRPLSQERTSLQSLLADDFTVTFRSQPEYLGGSNKVIRTDIICTLSLCDLEVLAIGETPMAALENAVKMLDVVRAEDETHE